MEKWDSVRKKRWCVVVRQTTVHAIGKYESFVRLPCVSRYSQTFLSPPKDIP